MKLDPVYTERMRNLLGGEYEMYIECLDNVPYSGLRANPLKVNAHELLKLINKRLEPVPWCENGYYTSSEYRPSKSVYYNAGLFYIQEPSAMSAVPALGIEPGDKVLDLCAAPGGKSTQAAAMLNGSGVIVSNDISASRCKALIKNIELFGVTNAVVTCESPERLVDRFHGFFNKIIIDAPCSGEGMFRKMPETAADWNAEKVERINKIQRQIIETASLMLSDGGKLLYSTCTFSPLENEQVVDEFLSSHNEFKLIKLSHGKLGLSSGIGLHGCGRIFPHRQHGEGHFIAVLQKDGTAHVSTSSESSIHAVVSQRLVKPFYDFCRQYLNEGYYENIINDIRINNNHVYHVSGHIGENSLDGLRVMRSGWYLGELRNGRFEPSQAFALGLKIDDAKNTIVFEPESRELAKYLSGESLDGLEYSFDGYCLICVGAYPLGWGKISGCRLKNKMAPGFIKG